MELCLEFDVQPFEAKNRVFEFDYQEMNTSEFVRRSLFEKMMFEYIYSMSNLVNIVMAIKFNV